MIRILVSMFLLAPLAAAQADTLEDRLAPLARAAQGQGRHRREAPPGGETFALNADVPMPTASLIKLAVMVEAYLQADEGKVKLTDMVTLRDDDKVPGSGILTEHFSDGATFSLRDAVRLMIAFSDNTATNLVLDRIGIEPVNKRMDDAGAAATRGSTPRCFAAARPPSIQKRRRSTASARPRPARW